MVDKEIIKGRLLKLEEYINDLKEFQSLEWRKYKDDKLVRRFIERTLQLTIEACLDIGNHIIADERLGIADSNQDIMKILHKNDIIQDNLDNYIRMAKFRNVIVHDYAKLDDEVIFNILKENLEDLEKFFMTMKNYIEK